MDNAVEIYGLADTDDGQKVLLFTATLKLSNLQETPVDQTLPKRQLSTAKLGSWTLPELIKHQTDVVPT